MRPTKLPFIALVVTLSVFASGVSAAGATSGAPGDGAFEVILRDDVPTGTAPSFSVVETDLDGLFDLVVSADDDQTIEMNGSAWISASPPDPQSPNQWSLDSSQLLEAWTRTTGSADTVIAVIDTGVNADANLGGRLLAGATFIDGGDPLVDPSMHGTWVAEVAAAEHDEIGIAGVCPGCAILPVQVGDAEGRVQWSAAAAGITWAVDNGADIINLSFGSNIQSQTITDAVNYALANDVIVIGAAGNNGTATEFFPAAIDGVLGVAAHDATDARYVWSNYGPWADVSAPGCSIGRIGSSYGTICGTSFAAPIVAGAIGLAVFDGGALDPAAAELIVEAGVRAQDWVETGAIDAAAIVAGDDEDTTAEDVVEEPRFTDVPAGAFYSTPVEWLAETGVTSGTSPTTFSPHQNITRGQFATFMWRFYGKPSVDTENHFTDVPDGAYYTRAVLWMASTGATSGTSPTTFSPHDDVSRAHFATFLWRMEQGQS